MHCKNSREEEKKLLCHVNMLKSFHERNREKGGEVVEGVRTVSVVNITTEAEEEWSEVKLSRCEGMVLENSAVFWNLNDKLGHKELENKERIRKIIEGFSSLFLMHLEKQMWWYTMWILRRLNPSNIPTELTNRKGRSQERKYSIC